MAQAFPKLSFVLGGAASGKSAFAENLVRSSGYEKIYVATAQAFDDEMRAKIATHKSDRGPDWKLIEAPTDLTSALKKARSGQILLVDCLTLWLSNTMHADLPLDNLLTEFLIAVSDCPAPIVAVSNEVGSGIVPEHKISRDFRNAQGRVNQQVAAAADLAVLVTAGLPTVLKGQLP